MQTHRAQRRSAQYKYFIHSVSKNNFNSKNSVTVNSTVCDSYEQHTTSQLSYQDIFHKEMIQ